MCSSERNKMQNILHNLKSAAIDRIGCFGANAHHQVAVCRKSLFSRAIATYATGLIKCWQCGLENSSAGIQFKCIKCQCLLDLPNDVVIAIYNLIRRTIIVELFEKGDGKQMPGRWRLAQSNFRSFSMFLHLLFLLFSPSNVYYCFLFF